MASFSLHGTGVSGGIAIGRAQLVSHATLEVARYTIPASRVTAEIARFESAVNEVQKELETPHGAMTSDDPIRESPPMHSGRATGHCARIWRTGT